MEGKVRWSSEYYESSSLLAFLPLDLYINLFDYLARSGSKRGRSRVET